jgi:hypothetical protein
MVSHPDPRFRNQNHKGKKSAGRYPVINKWYVSMSSDRGHRSSLTFSYRDTISVFTLNRDLSLLMKYPLINYVRSLAQCTSVFKAEVPWKSEA